VPFCEAKCTYCDFFSVPGEGQDLQGTLDALLVEAERRAPRRPRTVYLGGGTPSYYPVEDLARLLDGLDRSSSFRSSASEVTCECNPESLDLEKARALRELGVDRLSIGFQSLDPRILSLFGRVHTREQSLAAFEAARTAGFERLSIDLIYGVPGQELEAWEAELDRIAALAPEHISAYQLTYEEGTLMYSWSEERSLDRLSEERELAFFQAAHHRLQAHGYNAYEVSNFSFYGYECLHNLNYWRNGHYVGIGPSAVSKLGVTRFGNPRQIVAWRQALSAGRLPAVWEETPDEGTRLGETWWLGLRTREGLSPGEARSRAGLAEGSDPSAELASELLARGFLEQADGDRLRLSERGWPVADAIARRFLAACAAPRNQPASLPQ
jgi:oxygen-independent coproporphyrinogen-3 oxidase